MQFRRIILTSFILVLIGGAGLAYIFFQTLPTLGPRWLFYFFLLTGVSGMALPITAFLNYRFQGNTPPEANVFIREAIFCGICVDLLAWLQLGRELTVSTGVIIASGFIVIEVLLRVSERSRFKPGGSHE